jgi:hypothetical protein
MRKHGNKELMLYTDIYDKPIKERSGHGIRTTITVILYVVCFAFVLWVFLSSLEVSLNNLDPNYVYNRWNIFKLIT